MAERIRRRPERHSSLGPSGPDDFLAADSPGLVTVSCGPYAERLPVGQMTAGEVRARYRDRFDIDPHSQAVIDGREVDDSVKVVAGQILTFVRKSGEKGT